MIFRASIRFIPVFMLSCVFACSSESKTDAFQEGTRDSSTVYQAPEGKADAAKTSDFRNFDTISVDKTRSKVCWKGEKIVKSHDGTIDLAEAFLLFDKDQLAGGVFVLDMNSISVRDLEGEDKSKLEKKLKGEEFFKVNQFQETRLRIVNVYEGMIDADLTILGKAKRISFPYTLKTDGTEQEIVAQFKIDRTDWGIIYGSGTFLDLAKDKAIDDFISFEVSLVLEKGS